jgi:dephospho-CoA kinase
MDYVIVISSLIRYRTERVMSKNNITREGFLKRVSLQWSDEDKESMADYIIQNNSDLENLEKEAKKIFNTLL